MKRVALVTGCSSGIGLESALALAREGYAVRAGVRDESRAGPLSEAAAAESLDVQTVRLDVADGESVREATESVLRDAGAVDVLVNNAGYGLFGCVEDISLDDMRAQFETNFFGAVALIQRLAPSMRARKAGRIINISSVAGRIGFPCSPAYVSSKFALEGLSECMRYELGPHGIETVIIEPGVIKTPFMDNIVVPESADSPYAEITQKVISGIKMMASLGTPPSEVARTVVKAATEDNPPPRYVVGNDASMFLETRASMTDAEFEEYIKKELY